ncbi:hypothetical protein ABT248_32465 [Streptomyces sp. NPDC000971]|uniref:hypothetical protein n=1 Tax=Streptomyces sp. NPDC000971 TaxID=3156647 RepID=UPI0033242490
MIGNSLVALRGRLWINPAGDAHALQCVARTRKGDRCQNPVEYGQILGHHEFQLGSAGYVQAYGSPWGPDTGVDVDRWLAQHCTTHDSPDVTDAAVPELRRFNVRRDASYIRPYRTDAAYDDSGAEEVGGEPESTSR